MSCTFDAIGETTSLRAVAEEWREGQPGRAGPEDFEANLRRVLVCVAELKRERSAKNVFAFFQSVEHQLAAKSTVLGEAISDVVSAESNLDRLLAARDELAVDILEALQMVRSLASHALTE
jgi:hypothetical protein